MRDWLKDRLPEYMLPSSFTVLKEFPLNFNGKIDRKALPEPDIQIRTDQQAPQTESEHLLCNLWSDVLGIEVNDILGDFFEAGGHSLLVTQLVSRIRESFGIEMPLRMIFELPVLRDQSQWLDNRQRGSELPPIKPLAEGEAMVLSFAQQRLWFLSQLEGESDTYNMPAALYLESELDAAALERALTSLVQRQSSLRLYFPMVDGEATVKLIEVYNPLRIIDLSNFPEAEQQLRVTDHVAKHAHDPFDLNTGPLLRVLLLKLGNQNQVLLFNMHHIISDGWSMGVLIREWSHLYNAFTTDQSPQLSQLSIQYTDYAAWQRQWLKGDVLEQQREYWTGKLAGAPQLLKLPTDYPQPPVQCYQGKLLETRLSKELSDRVKALSRQNGVTVFMTVLAAFKLLLSRYSGQTDVVVGSPIANRTHRQTEDLIGFFVNTLVLRTQINPAQTFEGLLKEVRKTTLEAFSHQDIPFEYLVEQLNPSRSLSFSPLFQAMLVFQNAPSESIQLNGIDVSASESEHTISKFDLTLSVAEHEEGFSCGWEYSVDLFRRETIERMAGHFAVLLEGVLKNGSRGSHWA